MTSLDYRALGDALLPAVLAAGRAEMTHYKAGVVVESKADNSPVTAADREAEAIILEALAAIAPDIPVIAEEASSTGALPQIGDRFFLVDPLDGTKEFIHQRDEFTVNIAMVDACRPIFGIVYAPALSRIYLTLGPNAAGEADLAVDAQVGGLGACGLKPIHGRPADPKAVTAIASRSHCNDETEAFLRRYNISQRTSAGSSLKFCLLARGDADLYPRIAPTMEWDTAAGHAILAAAGGTVLNLDGTAFCYGKTGSNYLNPGFIAWGQKPLAAER